MSSFTPSRRSVLRTAAWSAPVVAVAAAAPAFATSGAAGEFTTITTEPIPFDATNALLGSFGVWTVTLTSRVPVNVPVGTEIPAPELTAVVTVSEEGRALIAKLGVTEVSGTAVAQYPVQGKATPLEANLTIPKTAVPTVAGPFDITTNGNGSAFVADTAGTFTISLADIATNLTISPAVLGITETAVALAPQGGAQVFATFTVA